MKRRSPYERFYRWIFSKAFKCDGVTATFNVLNPAFWLFLVLPSPWSDEC